MQRLLGLVALTALTFACKARHFHNDTDPNTLRAMERVSSTEVASFKLGFAAQNGIPHKVFKDVIHPTLPHVERRHTVRITFENLTEAHYRLLMDHYGGQGLVPFATGRTYELVDFLPPKIQALADRWLVPTTQTDPRIPQDWGDPRNPGSPVDVSIGMNCWATAYEVLRDFGKPLAQLTGKIAYFGPMVADTLLNQKREFQELQEPLPRTAWAAGQVAERNKNRKPGDLLWIKTKDSLMGPAHVALWLDNDLYFEKTNYSGEDPIRFAFFDDVVKAYLEQDDAERPMEMKFIRYKAGALPAPETLAGKHPYPDMPHGALPAELQKTVVFTLDAGISGSLNVFAANRILTFPVKQDPATRRAVFEGATALKPYLVNDTLCTDYAWEGTYKYRIDTAMQLFIFNQQGKQVAKLGGKVVNKTENGVRIFAEFPSGDKVLRLQGESALPDLVHPGVTQGENVMMKCAREASTFNQL